MLVLLSATAGAGFVASHLVEFADQGDRTALDATGRSFHDEAGGFHRCDGEGQDHRGNTLYEG